MWGGGCSYAPDVCRIQLHPIIRLTEITIEASTLLLKITPYIDLSLISFSQQNEKNITCIFFSFTFFYI